MAAQKEQLSLNIPDSRKPRVVVAGAGFGGMNLVKKLDTRLFQVVLIDRFNYHTFQPLLYQVATSGLEPDSVAGPLRKIFRKKKDLHIRMVSLHEVEPEHKRIRTTAGTLSYDHLVIATGSMTNFFGFRELAGHAYPLKQITHALDLRSRILQQFEKLTVMKEPRDPEGKVTFVVVGAGPTGVELCGALAELKTHILPSDYPDLDTGVMRIVLVEGLNRVLPGMSDKSGRRAHRYLERMGVEVRLETMTEGFDGQAVRLKGGDSIPSQTLVWAAGVKGNLVGGVPAPADGPDRIPVDPYHRVYDDHGGGGIHDGLYAIGDVALMHSRTYPKGHPGLAAVAIQQGKHLARNLNRVGKGRKPTPFNYVNKGVMATIGRNRAVADLRGGMRLGGMTGWIAWMFLHLFYMVGFRNKAVILTNWIWNYLTYDRGTRLIIRPSTKEDDPVSREILEEMNEI